jgi:chromosomal replication initiation ATPase DnaA
MINPKYIDAKVTKTQILKEVCLHYEVTENDIKSKIRKGNKFVARSMYLLLINKFIEENHRNLKPYLGRNSPASIGYMIETAQFNFENSLTFRNNYNVIEAKLLKK